MSLRKKPWERCPYCKMRQNLCICALIPRLSLATKLILIITKRELNVPTNTGRLAAQALTNSAILVRGVKDQPYDLASELMPDRPTLLLYPSEEATPLSHSFLHSLGGPCNLIVPDGNWRQTSKMRQRDALLSTFPIVKIPAGPPSAYYVRKESKQEGLATIEAIARALGIMENAEVQQSLEDLLEAMVSRILQSRGVSMAGINEE